MFIKIILEIEQLYIFECNEKNARFLEKMLSTFHNNLFLMSNFDLGKPFLLINVKRFFQTISKKYIFIFLRSIKLEL